MVIFEVKKGLYASVDGRIFKEATYSVRNDKYKVVSIGSKRYDVHRLIAEKFLFKIKGKDKIFHRDANTLNNDVKNLEWVDHLASKKDYKEPKNLWESSLAKSDRNKLIVEKSRNGMRHIDIAKEFKISLGRVSQIIRKAHDFYLAT